MPFYWDGKNLKALDKTTDATAGTPLVTANGALMQGRIVADACNNVFVGEADALVKVYQFDVRFSTMRTHQILRFRDIREFLFMTWLTTSSAGDCMTAAMVFLLPLILLKIVLSPAIL